MTARARPPFAGIRRIFPVGRSATSASPPGRNAIPHGTSSPVDTVRPVGTRGVRVGAGVAEGDDVALAVAVGDGAGSVGVEVELAPPEEDPHAARASARTTSGTARMIRPAAGGAPGA